MGVELPEFVNQFAGQDKGADLVESGLGSRRLLERLEGDTLRTRAMLATIFWRAWLASDLSLPVLASLGASHGVLRRSRTIIVCREDLLRFDLIVLDPVLSFKQEPSGTSLNRDFAKESIVRGAVRAFSENPLPLIGAEEPLLAEEVSSNLANPFAVVFSREPQSERLAVPTSPLTVDNGGTVKSTAGVTVEDLNQSGRFGVTAALHGVDPAQTVTVGTQTNCPVVRTDSITDSAFIEVPWSYLSTASTTSKAVMSGMAPRGNQKAEFTGHKSQVPYATVITGWDSQIPNPSSRRQACLYTRRDAQPGDSGSALVTDDGWIVGFAFERTKPTESPAQCSWIWAESVLNRLNLKPI